MTEYFDVVFDGPPSHESGRFVEVEDDAGKCISHGHWVRRQDGYWALRFFSDNRKNKKHIHVAGTVAGKHIDECALCGLDIRNEIHSGDH